MSVTDTFGDIIRERRIALGITQQELARQIGCARVTIQKIEAHHRHPSLALAERLADYLNLTHDEQIDLFETDNRHIQPGPLQIASSAKLPVLPTPLFGRIDEIEALQDTLTRSEARLLTVMGPPGVGKTSLAIHVATLVQQHYHHQVIWLSLASVNHPDLVLYEIAQALEIRESTHQSLVEIIQYTIGKRRVLLLLDNFEHLLAAIPTITQLLADNPNMQLMVTSRTRLGIPGEHTFIVEPLPAPSPEHVCAEELLRQSPAVMLFAERAKAAYHHFILTESNAAEVTEICQRLDGLPLAIELAAARSATLTPPMLLAQLEQHVDILVDPTNQLPPRQQTLDAAIAWSYDLLTDAEQQLLQYLAVFAQGESLDAIAALCDIHDLDIPEGVRLIHTLDSLIQHSLVYTLIAADGEMHYAMLETIRSYARKQLMIHPKVSTLFHRHADYYYRFLTQANSQLRGPDAKLWVARLIEAFPNLRLAFQWFVTHDVEGAARFVVATRPLFDRCSYATEGRQWLTQVFEHAEQSTIEPTLQAELHQMAGNLAYMQGEYSLGEYHLQETLAVYIQIQDLPGLAKITNHLGNLAMRQGCYSNAQTWYTQSLNWARQDGNQYTIARALYGLAGVAGALARWEEAEDLHRQTLDLRKQLNDSWGMALNLLGLGNVLRQFGQTDQARALCERSLTLWKENHDLRGTAGALHALGHIALEQNCLEEAHQYFVESTRAWQQLGMSLELAWSLEAFARLAAQQQQTAQASTLFIAATAVRTHLQSPRTPAECLQLIAVIQADRAYDHLSNDIWISIDDARMLVEEIVAEV
ncbi:MAG: tetratricopeptide repeat protein [Chloroflexota bacterium]